MSYFKDDLLMRLKRYDSSINQAKLAEIIGKSPGTVSRAHDLSNFSVEDLVKLADAYNCSVDELLGRDTQKKDVSFRELCRFIVALDEAADLNIYPRVADCSRDDYSFRSYTTIELNFLGDTDGFPHPWQPGILQFLESYKAVSGIKDQLTGQFSDIVETLIANAEKKNLVIDEELPFS